jgi:hypothetical protein
MSYQPSAAAFNQILARATAGPLTTDRETLPRRQVPCGQAVLIS